MLQDFYKFLRDDDALLRAARAQWMLVPVSSMADTPSGDPRELHANGMGNGKTQETFIPDGNKIARPMGSIDLEEEECVIGSDSDCQCRVDCTTVGFWASNLGNPLPACPFTLMAVPAVPCHLVRGLANACATGLVKPMLISSLG